MNLDQLISEIESLEKYKEIWLFGGDGQSICALINGNRGWLMYLRNETDTGFSSRNLDEVSEKEMKFVLSNGQEDYYPTQWTYSISLIKDALLEFLTSQALPKNITWHDDSN